MVNNQQYALPDMGRWNLGQKNRLSAQSVLPVLPGPWRGTYETSLDVGASFSIDQIPFVDGTAELV